MPNDRRTPDSVLITGATGGIGGALARLYAEPGKMLILHGRDKLRLEDLAMECEARGARVRLERFDLVDAQAVVSRLQSLAVEVPVDLAILGAGVTSSIGSDGEGESWGDVRHVMEVNLQGALATVAGILPHMRQRHRGQIALISSLSAYYGLPVTPAYCASKAALKAYGEALRGWLAPEGVAINIVLPGFVASAMSARFPAGKPFLMSTERAARIIRRGLARDKARISFPFPLSWGMWWLSVLPPRASQYILQALGYGAR